jgi:hypothetical protein
MSSPVITPVSIKLPRSIGTVTFDATIEERHEDEWVMTEQPVEVGSTITDHIYKMPAMLDITAVSMMGSPQNNQQDPSFLRTLYNTLLALGGALLPVQTGKRTYKNMAIRSLRINTDKTSENILSISISLQEILLATTTLVTVTPIQNQAIPQKTAGTINQGPVNTQPASNFNPPTPNP